ncbi:copper chaperone PCu(A)C [Reinekea blandensis]|uniref:Copper chaperone PCu(A)C n=1 Tax=Reinekea blandensis MED297 TaxID=314283 RepID=A4B9S8_9GAMM|nr:copper chaperone PCu(A)C [Reinekea blandensis]EAR11379.1 hypothetical protein MED297_20867 [Reinekea sp. MED297] [Reinekea blandensis MED297]
MKKQIFAWGLLLLSAISTFAADNNITIHHAWARPSAPGAPSAGFMTVVNQGQQDDVLLSVEGDFAARLELHLSSMVEGVMKMEHQQEGIVIPAGETIMFKPGGYHLMFMGLAKNFELGETYVVELTFRDAGVMTLSLPVQQAPESSH